MGDGRGGREAKGRARVRGHGARRRQRGRGVSGSRRAVKVPWRCVKMGCRRGPACATGMGPTLSLLARPSRRWAGAGAFCRGALAAPSRARSDPGPIQRRGRRVRSGAVRWRVEARGPATTRDERAEKLPAPAVALGPAAAPSRASLAHTPTAHRQPTPRPLLCALRRPTPPGARPDTLTRSLHTSQPATLRFLGASVRGRRLPDRSFTSSALSETASVRRDNTWTCPASSQTAHLHPVIGPRASRRLCRPAHPVPWPLGSTDALLGRADKACTV